MPAYSVLNFEIDHSSCSLPCREASLLYVSAAFLLQFVKLKAFSKFDNTTEALAAATALVESKLSKGAPAGPCLHCACRALLVTGDCKSPMDTHSNSCSRLQPRASAEMPAVESPAKERLVAEHWQHLVHIDC